MTGDNQLPFVEIDPSPALDVPLWIVKASSSLDKKLAKSMRKHGTEFSLRSGRFRRGSDLGACEWHGCTERATERHHVRERAIFGILANALPTVALCGDHHRFVTEIHARYYQWLHTQTEPA